MMRIQCDNILCQAWFETDHLMQMGSLQTWEMQRGAKCPQCEKFVIVEIRKEVENHADQHKLKRTLEESLL